MKMIDEKSAARVFGVSLDWLAQARKDGRLTVLHLKISFGIVLYDREALGRWVHDQRVAAHYITPELRQWQRGRPTRAQSIAHRLIKEKNDAVEKANRLHEQAEMEYRHPQLF